MGRFWDARAREDAMYFVDNRVAYGGADAGAFFAEGERTLERLLGSLGLEPPTGVVVDVGCGLGRLSRALAAHAERVEAIDVSAEMLARARELNGELDNVVWHQGDGVSLQPIVDAAADAVVSHVVFQHIPDPAITYGYVTEMGRVLRPGGWAAFQVSNDPAVHAPRSRSYRLRAALRLAPRGQHHPAWLGSAVSLDALRAAAARGGMVVERTVGDGTQFCLVRARRLERDGAAGG